MPGTLMARDELKNAAVAPDEEMSRYFQIAQLREVRVGIRIEPVGKQPLDGVAGKFTRRQADIVDDQQVYGRAGRTAIVIRRPDMSGAADPTGGVNFHRRPLFAPR